MLTLKFRGKNSRTAKKTPHTKNGEVTRLAIKKLELFNSMVMRQEENK